MLNQTAELLGGLVDRDKWVALADRQGAYTKLGRAYVDGDHRARLTPPMKKMLRIESDQLDRFNMNYCPLIIESMGDRLTVSQLSPSDENAKEWGTELLAANRFDALQMDMHEACLTDGDTYLLMEWDNDQQRVVWHHEDAWDGYQGVIPVYDRAAKTLLAAVKIWYEGDLMRQNVYYQERVDKFAEGDNGLKLIESAEWLPKVLPVIHFRNKQRNRRWYGESELLNVIPLQDALNRNTVSMVMTAELSAFQIRVAKGFNGPRDVAPGMWIDIKPEDTSPETVQLLNAMDAFVLDQAQLVPFINQGNYLINQIATISRTPIPGTMGGTNESGEALKQREAPLLAKVRKSQIKWGNLWEDAMVLAARIEAAYGTSAPAITRWTAHWQDAQVRSEVDQIKNASLVADRISERAYLELLGRVYGWDAAKIETIMQEKRQESAANVAALGLPGFDQFNLSPN